jgi:hypothetical protein
MKKEENMNIKIDKITQFVCHFIRIHFSEVKCSSQCFWSWPSSGLQLMVNLPQPPSHPAHIEQKKLLLHYSRCPVLQDGQEPWVCIPLQKFPRQFGIQPVQASKQGKDMVCHRSQSKSRLLRLGVIFLSLYFCLCFSIVILLYFCIVFHYCLNITC